MSNKKDIIMIGPSPFNRGGISSVIQSLLELEPIYNRTFLVSSYSDGNKLKKILAFLKGIVQCLFILIFNRQVEILHIHTASRGSFFRKRIFVKLGKWFGKKIILHIHGAEFMMFYQESNDTVKKQIREILDQVDVIITLSKKWKVDIESITDNRNVKVIYNAIDSKKFNLSNLDEQNILFMGRIGTRKGIYDLVDIIPQIIEDFPNVKLHIAGDGDLQTLKRRIEELNINSSICIHGWINHNQKVQLLEQSSIFTLPSYNEGLPVSILEAMAAGLPVISTNIGGIPEQIDNAYNGFIIKPGDKEALLEHINFLLKDKNARKNFGENAKYKVNESFSLPVIGDEILNMYSILISDS
ncbi:glycosyltransferase family 4 protein [Bacillus sp. DX1.1]|uniref:glycosyltransferase family 4 protein n=1 Tax=unclassified Bacillus (in: firmicutes) TaxID=185979 RepID=UPI00256FC975|nr:MULTISPECIES: glycosyltransferase family 4 protein [unclassified Bacillus (in: firmicutes)]MDM5157371.1 glycosyltransferase family 4 protein [Bacillus sp. DX1.1]WJE81596.1 glycosyltransferase family 4 protein [Bacillus sp. DX3.1]